MTLPWLPSVMKGGRYLEEKHVRKVYDTIAPSFNEIPQKVWPNVKKFIKNLHPGSLVADIGCGNGRYLHINKSVYKFGVDACYPLVELSGEKGYEVLVADNQSLPFRDGAFDAVISVGVLHHFSTEPRRVKALKELCRILRPGGKLLVYVWAYEQKHRRFDGQDVLIPWHAGKKVTQKGLFNSDQDISSTSSISEDESIDSTRHVIQRTVSDPSCPCCQPSQTTLINKLLSSKPLSARQRSNTLPSSLEALTGNHDDESEIQEECRKLQMSLREMSASHNHLSASNDSVFCNGATNENDEDGIVFESKHFSNISDFSRENEISACEKTDISNQISNEPCQIPSQNLASTHNNCDVNLNVDSPDSQLDQTGIVTNNNEKPTKKMSLFDTMKKRFLKFIDSKFENKSPTDHELSASKRKTSSENKSGRHINIQDVNSQSTFACFAVREFPMSSCHNYRHSLSSTQDQNSIQSFHDPDHHTTQPAERIYDNGQFQNYSTNLQKEQTSSWLSTVANDSDSRQSVNTSVYDQSVKDPQNSSGLSTISISNSQQNSHYDLEKSHKKIDKNVRHKCNKTLINGHQETNSQDVTKVMNGASKKQCNKVVNLNGHKQQQEHEGGMCNISHSDNSQSNILNAKTSGKRSHDRDIPCDHDLSHRQNGSTDSGIHNGLKNNSKNGCDKSSHKKYYETTKTTETTETNSISGETTTQHNISRETTHSQNTTSNCYYRRESSGNEYASQSECKNGKSSVKNNSPLKNKSDEIFQKNGTTHNDNSRVNRNQNHIRSSENISSSRLSNQQSFKSCDTLHNGANYVPSSSSTMTEDEFRMSTARLCRFYHVFKQGELSDLIFKYIDNLCIVSCTYDHGNWCLIAEKIDSDVNNV
ncbi:serine-rich adhesin for platelets-like [Mytilus edulis]|uniref:serine-rich adhesin for platelets-like n=1 Tax=Mytilus edulis TaxID=6550 RepID=UPI0039EEBE5B